MGFGQRYLLLSLVGVALMGVCLPSFECDVDGREDNSGPFLGSVNFGKQQNGEYQITSLINAALNKRRHQINRNISIALE